MISVFVTNDGDFRRENRVGEALGLRTIFPEVSAEGQALRCDKSVTPIVQWSQHGLSIE